MSYYTLWVTQRQFQMLRRYYRAQAAKAGRPLSWNTMKGTGGWNETVWII